MSHVQMVEFFNVLILLGSIGASLAIAVQAHYEIKMARLECERKRQFDLQHLTVIVVRHELRNAGYYQLTNKDDCPPQCKRVLDGLHLICLVFVAADDHFNVTAYQMKCLEGNNIFDGQLWTDEQIRGHGVPKTSLDQPVKSEGNGEIKSNVERRMEL